MEFNNDKLKSASFLKQVNKMKKNEINIIAYLVMQKDNECLGYTARQLSEMIFDNHENFKRLYDSINSLNEKGIIKMSTVDPGRGHKGYINIRLRNDWAERIVSLYDEEQK